MLRFILNDLTGRISVNRWAKWLIGTVLLIALVLRVRAVSFGLPAMNDPDELIFELGAVKMLREGTLNPGWFGHPATTTLYLLAAIDVAVFAVGHVLGWFPTVQAFGDAIYQDPSWVVLPSRTAMALFGVWCVFLTYRLGERLFDRRVGLVAAALLAISPIHISYSQIVRSDVMATAFLLLMLLASLDFLRTGKWKSVLTAALWFGFATTTKWPFAACAISFAAAALYRFWTGKDRLADTMRRLAGFGCAGIVAILLISPYLALDYKTALQSVMGEAQVRHVGATGQGALWNAGWYLRGPLLHALGWAGLALSAIGGVIAVRKREPALLFFPLIAVLVAVTLPQNLIWARWILPLLPLLTILAAAAFAGVMERSCTLPRLTRRTVMVALYAATFTPLLLLANSDAAERMNDTRQVASHWADTHLQPGSSVMVEHFGFDLLSRPWEFYFPLADAGCVNARQMLHGKVQYAAVEAVRGGHHNVDYGTLTPAMRPTCNVQYAIFSQYDRYMAEAPMFPREVASYRELMARSHLIATIRPQPGVMGGPTIRIVRIDSPYQVPQARGRNGGL